MVLQLLQELIAQGAGSCTVPQRDEVGNSSSLIAWADQVVYMIWRLQLLQLQLYRCKGCGGACGWVCAHCIVANLIELDTARVGEGMCQGWGIGQWAKNLV